MKKIHRWFRHLGYAHYDSDLSPVLYHVAHPLLGEVAIRECQYCGRRIAIVLGWE